MKLAIMQPYFLPYIGYFQLLNAVDEFVVYDNIEFTKRGWIQRNRILMNGSDSMFSLPLKKASDYLEVRDRQLSDSFGQERIRIMRRIESAYRRSPYFTSVMPVIERCFNYESANLFEFIYNSLLVVCEYLGITTRITISSGLASNHSLKGQDRVVSICQELSADYYINAIGGRGLYRKEAFAEKGIQLSFIKSEPIVYPQFDNEFAPSLSIVDVMMFNVVTTIGEYLERYELV